MVKQPEHRADTPEQHEGRLRIVETAAGLEHSLVEALRHDIDRAYRSPDPEGLPAADHFALIDAHQHLLEGFSDWPAALWTDSKKAVISNLPISAAADLQRSGWTIEASPWTPATPGGNPGAELIREQCLSLRHLFRFGFNIFLDPRFARAVRTVRSNLRAYFSDPGIAAFALGSPSNFFEEISLQIFQELGKPSYILKEGEVLPAVKAASARKEEPSMADDRRFDEEFYLRTNPDVAQAVARGVFSSGWEHFQRYGEREGRIGVAREPQIYKPVAHDDGTLVGGANLGYSEGWDPGKFECPDPLPRHIAFLKQFAAAGSGDCIEIGCYPGTYLRVFGEMGYTLHGIDFTPRVSEVAPYLASLGYKIGTIEHADFRTHEFRRTYDVVYSLGFIEHFTDWHHILARHLPLVADNGMLIVGAPNMSGFFQRLIWRLFDPKTYYEHYIPSMSAEHWKAVLETLGFDVEFCGITWGCDLLTGESGLTSQGRWFLFRLLQQVAPHMVDEPELKTPATGYYSAVMARKRRPGNPALLLQRPEVQQRLQEIAESAIERDKRIDAEVDQAINTIDALVGG